MVVAVPHSAPTNTDSPADATAFMTAWVADTNIDILSPTLYSTGTESSPVYDETSNCKSQGCVWTLFKNAKGSFVPSIVVGG